MEPTPTDPPATARAQQRVSAAAPQPRRQGRVRAIARAAGRTCSRPSCDTPAAATLVFSYHEQVARVVELLDQGEPQAYDLCGMHADRTTPPRGWELSDTRAPRADAPRRLDDEETVAVLAAALRGETPPTRVSLLEGGREDEVDEAEAVEVDAALPALGTGRVAQDELDHVLDDDLEIDLFDDGSHDDPLRAALEELQRVSARDDDPTVVAAEATPLRRPEPPVAETVKAQMVETTAAPPADDDLTLW